jgi:hypothetical protein
MSLHALDKPSNDHVICFMAHKITDEINQITARNLLFLARNKFGAKAVKIPFRHRVFVCGTKR